MIDARLFCQKPEKPSSDRQRAIRLHEKLLDALDRGDHDQCLDLTEELRLIYLELWKGDSPSED